MISLLLAAATTALPPHEVAQATGQSERVEALQSRVYRMRMILLLGGERVRQADEQAIEFYDGKIGVIEQRLFEVDSELTEKRATYELALDKALGADSLSSRTTAIWEAAHLSDTISGLELESGDLAHRRGRLSKVVAYVRARQRERSRLAEQLATAGAADLEIDLTLPSLGWARTTATREDADSLENDALVRDLLDRDPRRARQLLFEIDPQGYWVRFTLRPPLAELWGALEFPQADLPGLRLERP